MTTITPLGGKHLTASQREDYRFNLEKNREDWLKRFTVFRSGELVLTLNPMGRHREHVLVDIPVSTWQDFSDPCWVPMMAREFMMDKLIPGCYPVLYMEPYLEYGISPALHLMAKILVDEQIVVCREDHLVKMPEHFLKTLTAATISTR